MKIFEIQSDPSNLDQNRARIVAKKCKPLLDQITIGEDVLYRGIRNSREGFEIVSIRKDRRPKDLSEEFTEMLNGYISDMGLTTNRTNSVFVTSDYEESAEYGEIRVIFPIGEFNYTWSPAVKDVYIESPEPKLNFRTTGEFGYISSDSFKEFFEVKNLLDDKQRKLTGDTFKPYNNTLKAEHFTKEDIDEFNKAVEVGRRRIIGKLQYQGDDGSLSKAIARGHEIMIKGDSYISMAKDFYSAEFIKYLIQYHNGIE